MDVADLVLVRFQRGPGAELFDAIGPVLGKLPVIAEDLGVITPDVEVLRDQFGLPGMRTQQFGFDADAQHPFLPHSYVADDLACTGTYDNDTFAGWWANATANKRAFAETCLDSSGAEANWAAMRMLSESVAQLLVFPLQDVLGLPSLHRMNTPSTLNCGTWRLSWDMVGSEAESRLARISIAFGRAPIERLDLPTRR